MSRVSAVRFVRCQKRDPMLAMPPVADSLDPRWLGGTPPGPIAPTPSAVLGVILTQKDQAGDGFNLPGLPSVNDEVITVGIQGLSTFDTALPRFPHSTWTSRLRLTRIALAG